MPMRICLGTASNRLSFSNSTSQPSFALAKVTGLTTTLLSGRHTQPAHDWLPTSIPQTYLMGASSCEEPDVVWLMFHLLVRAEPSLCFSPVRPFDLDQQARNPTDQSERQLILDGQSSLAACVRVPLDARNKPHRPFEPQWTGSSLSKAGLCSAS